MTDHFDVIMTALHERRNRLVQLDLDQRVNPGSVRKLRARIKECDDAMRALRHAKSGHPFA